MNKEDNKQERDDTWLDVVLLSRGDMVLYLWGNSSLLKYLSILLEDLGVTMKVKSISPCG
jgi:hypothetical protein